MCDNALPYCGNVFGGCMHLSTRRSGKFLVIAGIKLHSEDDWCEKYDVALQDTEVSLQVDDDIDEGQMVCYRCAQCLDENGREDTE